VANVFWWIFNVNHFETNFTLRKWILIKFEVWHFCQQMSGFLLRPSATTCDQQVIFEDLKLLPNMCEQESHKSLKYTRDYWKIEKLTVKIPIGEISAKGIFRWGKLKSAKITKMA
jgi:hypothetical protein